MPPTLSRVAPALSTERLTLTAHAPDDFEDCASMWADPEVVRHIGGRPSSAQETWGRMLRYAGMWALLGHGYWVVRERGSGRFVGEVGLADFRRETEPPVPRVPEAGWALASWAHGRGFATEAVRAALAWSDAHVAAPRTVCFITPDNAASVRVAEKCGYRGLGTTVCMGAETLVFARPRG